jgi:hypothetical protein
MFNIESSTTEGTKKTKWIMELMKHFAKTLEAGEFPFLILEEIDPDHW